MLFLVAVVFSIFATVDYEDAIIEAKWVSARGLLHPKPGTLYVLEDDGLRERPICRLILSDKQLVGRGNTRKFTFSNVVGDLVPFLATINVSLLGSSGDDIETMSAAPFDLIWVADEVYVKSFRNVPMDRSCEADFHEALNAGSVICTVDRAIIAPGSDSTVYAVGFRDTCASECAKGETGCVAPKYEPESGFSWTTILKKEMGFIRLDKNSVESSADDGA